MSALTSLVNGKRGRLLRHGAAYVIVFALAAPALHLFLGLVLDRLLGAPVAIGGAAVRLAGVLAAAAGTAWILWAVWSLRRIGGGLPISSSPPSALVILGPYRYGRHPIYVGATCACFGAAVALGSFWGAALGAPLLGVFYFCYARGIEEPVLATRFGDAYRRYQARTALVVDFPLRARAGAAAQRLLSRLSRAANRPRILRRGGHILFWGYGLWPGLGVALGLAATEFVLVSQGVPPNRAAAFIAVATGAGLFGSRMVWRLVLAARDRIGFRRTAATAGFVSWGALLGMVLAAPAFAAITGRPVLLCLDAALPGLLIAHFFGRIGCTLYGCCYGKPSAAGAHLCYRDPALKAVRERRVDPTRLIPVQPASALYGAFSAGVVLAAWTLVDLPLGVPAALCAVLYGLFRLSEEWLRVQTVTLRGGVSPAQVAALLLALLGLSYLAFGGALGPTRHTALGAVDARAVLASMHPLLLAGAGVLTLLVFSYHHGRIGRWH